MKLTRRFESLPFSKRLMMVVLVLNCLGAITVISSVAYSERMALVSAIDDEMSETIVHIKQSLSHILALPEAQRRTSLFAMLPVFASNARIDYLLLTNPSGGSGGLNWTRQGGTGSVYDRTDVSEVRAFIEGPRATADIANYHLFSASLLNANGAPAGDLVVGLNRNQISDLVVPRVTQITALLSVVLIAQILGMYWVLDRLVTRPMQRIQHQANKILLQDEAFDNTTLAELDDLQRIEKTTSFLGETMSRLGRSEAYLTAVLNSVHDAIIVVDEFGRIHSINSTCKSLWQYSTDELHNQSFGMLIAQRYRRLNEDYCDKAFAQREHTDAKGLVTTAISKQGQEFPINISYSPAVIGDKSMVVITAEDYSEQFSQQRALIEAKEQAERAEINAVDAAKAKASFLATMSHEIRTPMNGIVGVLDLLNGTVLNAEQGTLVETAIASSESLLTVLNDILDFSKLEAGKVGIEAMPFDLGRLVEDISILFSAAASEKTIALNCSVDPQLDQKVISDPTRLRQILSNIVGNAIKFTAEGEVNVRLRCIFRGEDQARIQLEVQDTGVGIPKELQGRLFQPFSQADESTTRQYGGTGLGLAICKQLSDLLGGKLWLESEPGRGTRFFLEMDLALSAESIGRKLSDKALHNLRVLVVDDNRTNRSILRGYFSHWGVNATVLSNPMEALEELRLKALKDPYDVCLTDYHMPEMDGLALAREIANDVNLSGIEVVMLSSGTVDRTETDKAGIRWLMSKPIRQSSLMDILAGCIDAEAAHRIEQREKEQSRFNLRALLVEDNPTNRMIASQMLKRLGVEVSTAENGEFALQCMTEENYDIVFMDCQMPVMDGYEATAVRRQQEQAGVDKATIIALTANALEGDQKRCLDAGMDDYLSKPVREEGLRNILTKWSASQISTH